MVAVVVGMIFLQDGDYFAALKPVDLIPQQKVRKTVKGPSRALGQGPETILKRASNGDPRDQAAGSLHFDVTLG